VIADRVKLPRVPISDILTAYLGDVMLYSQTAGDDDPEVQDFELPPRVGIRRRMVDAIVEFALRDYKAWYVVAHSQGTVVAYNGLMETAKTLPNYLNRGRWDLVRSSPLRLLGGPDDKLPGLQMPRRPPWLGAQDCIDRRNLFAKLRGFLTYGSAIGKFRGIWPIIVPANTDEHVFQREFNWINVYDWTDPVGGPLRAYNREKGYDANRTPLKDGDRVVKGHVAAKIDRNISYKAGWVWLLSHLQYLNYYPRAYKRPKALLVNKAAEWLLGGEFDPGETLEKAKPNGVIRYALALAEAGIATLVVWLATAALLWELLDSKWLAWLEYACWPSLAISALIVAIIANGCGALIGGTRRSVPRVVRWLVILIGCAAIAAPSFLLIPWVSGNIAGWWKAAGSTIGLLNHPGAGNMAIGLMSLTVTLIVALGGIRWLFQPIPAAPAPAEPAPAAPAPVPPPKDEKP